MTIDGYRELIAEGCFQVVMSQHREDTTDEDALRICKAMLDYMHVFGSVWARAIANDETGEALLGIADGIQVETQALAGWRAEEAGITGNA